MVSGYNLKLRSSVAATQQGTGAVNVNGSPTRFYVYQHPNMVWCITSANLFSFRDQVPSWIKFNLTLRKLI